MVALKESVSLSLVEKKRSEKKEGFIGISIGRRFFVVARRGRLKEKNLKKKKKKTRVSKMWAFCFTQLF